MALLPDNFIRPASSRKFLLLVVLLLAAASSAAVGWKLYQTYPEDSIKAASGPGLLPREWLIKYFANDDENAAGIGGPDGDPDGDILTNMQEFYFNTNPANPDTDNDGQIDGAEVAINSNPNGPGELYSTEFAKRIADQYLISNNLEEFKSENIEKQILGLLNPPDPAKIEVVLPDKKTLKISSQNTPEAIDRYFQESIEATDLLDVDSRSLQVVLQNPGGIDHQSTLGLIYEAMNKFRAVKVPSDALYFHQLRLAALQAAANLLEIAKTVDFNAEPETQIDKFQNQYYQIALVEKISYMVRDETQKLKDKYPEVVAKYESNATL